MFDLYFFFFKQKTAYEMRISDWSSDVCSSDLLTGGTAWIGLLRVASAKPGDTVFVSAAAGAVGSAVVQIAKAREMTVVGSAGGAEKCDWVLDLGADAVVDYKAEPVLPKLAAALERLGTPGRSAERRGGKEGSGKCK